MKIALYHNLPTGGALRSTVGLVEPLSRKHEIYCHSLSCAAEGGYALAQFSRETRVKPFSLRAPSFPARMQPLGWLLDLRRMTALQKDIAAEIQRTACDVLLTNTCPYFEIPSILRFLQIPSVYHSQAGTYPAAIGAVRQKHRNSRRRTLNPTGALLARAIQKHKIDSVRAAKVVLANSYFSREELYRDFGVNAVVVYPGIDVRDFYPEPGAVREQAVLGVGALAPFKAHDFSIEALAEIPEHLRPELWIAYHTEVPGERSYLVELAASRGVHLRLISNANTEDLRRLYSSVLAVVFPSVFEPLGLVPLESMACGTPAVGVAEGGIRETILHGETGFLTQRSTKRFAEAIMKLLAEPNLVAEMGARGREYVVERWRTDDAAENFEKVLLEAAQ